MGVFWKKSRNSSVSIAKDRLKGLLVSDRMNCTPDTLDKIEKDLYRTISKYMDVDRRVFDVRISRNQIHIKLTGENS